MPEAGREPAAPAEPDPRAAALRTSDRVRMRGVLALHAGGGCPPPRERK